MSLQRKLDQIKSLSNVVSDLVKTGDCACNVTQPALEVMDYLLAAAQVETAILVEKAGANGVSEADQRLKDAA